MMESKKGKYVYLEHTADLKFQAFGRTIEEAFNNAAYAMFNYLINPNKVKKIFTFEIRKISKNLESLLFDFLEELIFILDTQGFLLAEIKNTRIEKTKEGYYLYTMIKGDHHEGYEIRGDIKAVTYNDMLIKKEKDKIKVQVVIDI